MKTKTAYDIRRELAELGWESEDRISWIGWEHHYTITFGRRDWHDVLIGSQFWSVSFHESTTDLNKIDEAVAIAAARCKEAWRRFKKHVPMQGEGGEIRKNPIQPPLFSKE